MSIMELLIGIGLIILLLILIAFIYCAMIMSGDKK